MAHALEVGLRSRYEQGTCSANAGGCGRTHISTHRIPSHDLMPPEMLG
jgi:hypothetical protein